MLSPQEFVTEWTKIANNLVKFSAPLVENLALPNESKHFLIEAGLPQLTHYVTHFGLELNKANHIATPDDIYPYDDGSTPFKGYRIIGGNDFGDFLCIDEHNNGQLVEVSHETFDIKFYNSSIPQLAECLLAWHRRLIYLETCPAVIADEYERWLYQKIPLSAKAELEMEITRIDAKALNGYTVWREWINSIKAD